MKRTGYQARLGRVGIILLAIFAAAAFLATTQIIVNQTSVITARVQDSTGVEVAIGNLDVFVNAKSAAGSPLPVAWSAVGGTRKQG